MCAFDLLVFSRLRVLSDPVDLEPAVIERAGRIEGDEHHPFRELVSEDLICLIRISSFKLQLVEYFQQLFLVVDLKADRKLHFNIDLEGNLDLDAGLVRMDTILCGCGTCLEHIGPGRVIGLVVIAVDADGRSDLQAACSGCNDQPLQCRGFHAELDIQCGGALQRKICKRRGSIKVDFLKAVVTVVCKALGK